MRASLVLFVLTIVFKKSFANNETLEVDCLDIKSIPLVGNLVTCKNLASTYEVEVKFLLSTQKIRTSREFTVCDLTKLQNYFDPLEETIVIIHGYLSNMKRSWIWDLKEKLLDVKKANVIVVDWSSLSTRKNYVNAARNTVIATQHIYSFLQAIREESKNFKFSIKKKKWNSIYFIGHSLGAQVSGQTAYLLNRDKFWHVSRITGLDPAKPCFTDVEPKLRVDKQDADFVDIIHTQVGYGGSIDAFGLKQSIGHVDFYVNGGVVQPPCLGTVFTAEWTRMICSHQIAYKYFTESLLHSMDDGCKFISYTWDGSFEHAEQILELKRLGQQCSDCPELGINAVNSKLRGDFLIITSASNPFCVFEQEDTKIVLKVLKRLKSLKLETATSPNATATTSSTTIKTTQ